MMFGPIAILGATGDQGFGLALRWAKVGEKIIIGSRQQAKAEDAARRIREILGGNVSVEGSENPEATRRARITVLSVPLAAQLGILESVKDSFQPGDILVDLTVPLATALGGKATRTVQLWTGSAAEQAAQAVGAGVKVVSAFNNLSAEALQDVNSEVNCDVIVCSDHADAKATVMELVKKIPGASPVDGGKLENSRIVEQITALLIGINIRYKTNKTGIRITGI
ncbi:MAG: NADPH-dependent F420 reductase [Candidatus Bathyarchaeia archaeon]